MGSTISKMSCSNERMAGVGVNRVRTNTRKCRALLGLWGVPGALLSVPILVSLKVVCDRVPAMSSVSELLSR